jgi:hypothetical protein
MDEETIIHQVATHLLGGMMAGGLMPEEIMANDWEMLKQAFTVAAKAVRFDVKDIE